MTTLTLNFSSEKQIIPLPKELSTLKKLISEKYNISLSDVNELNIFYNNNEVKKIITSEIDYKVFLHSRTFELELEIKESSSFYNKNVEDLRNKKKEDLNRLNLLQKQKEENKMKQEKEIKETKKKLDELNNQIKTINQQKLDYVKSIKKIMRGPRNKEKELTIKITSLGNEIKAPLVFNLTEGNELPVKGETKKEIKYLDLIQRNTECLKVQEQLYSTPRKNMQNLDKRIREINKQCFDAIKSSQKKMAELKKEERNMILEIISLQKKIGLEKQLKKPMIKTGFYFPNRLQIEPGKNANEIKEKKETKLKSKNILKDIIIHPQTEASQKKKITCKKLFKNLKKLKIKTRTKLHNINKRINNIKETSKTESIELTPEEKAFLQKTKTENKNAKNEIDDWLQFILSHTKELISAYEHQNEVNIEKLKEIEKKLGNFKKGETLINYNACDGNNNNDLKKAHPGVYCNKCKENVVGVRYKCVICKDLDFCEKCEDKFKNEHGHPMLKINTPEMNPISINCSLADNK